MENNFTQRSIVLLQNTMFLKKKFQKFQKDFTLYIQIVSMTTYILSFVYEIYLQASVSELYYTSERIQQIKIYNYNILIVEYKKIT